MIENFVSSAINLGILIKYNSKEIKIFKVKIYFTPKRGIIFVNFKLLILYENTPKLFIYLKLLNYNFILIKI